MAVIRAFEITNLVINDERAAVADKYLIRSDNEKKDISIPSNIDEFINMYVGKEHKYTCTNAYSELRS